jgi:flagellar basal-body rod modification protein FlgD
MSIASIAAQQSAAAAAANLSAAGLTQSGSAAPASSTAPPSSSTSALSSLSSNFGDFLNLLMTQLQNQDPTSPLDSNPFTSELVQFSSVEQQINTNTSLTQLIQLTQGGEVMQASAMTGKQVTVQSTQVPLQSGQGTINFTAPGVEPVAIAIYNSSGAQLYDAAVTSVTGQNTFTWNGKDSAGNTVPDGAYNVAVIGANSDGSTTALPFTVTGTATGVLSNSTGMQLELGALDVNFSAVQSVGN